MKKYTQIMQLQDDLASARSSILQEKAEVERLNKKVARLETIIQFLGGWIENLAIKRGKTDRM